MVQVIEAKGLNMKQVYLHLTYRQSVYIGGRGFSEAIKLQDM